MALVVFCFFPYLACGEPARPDLVEGVEFIRANIFPANCSDPSVPDVGGWEVVQKSRVEFRISDEAAAYLGLAIEYTDYRNPLNVNEVVKVISSHIPLISERPKQLNERSLFEITATSYIQKEEQDHLDKLEKETDPILYMRWKIKKDSSTGRNMKDGAVDLWLMQPGGKCFSAQNQKVAIQFLTESVGDGKPRNVFVGVKYRIGDIYYILKVDRRDLIKLVEKEK